MHVRAARTLLLSLLLLSACDDDPATFDATPPEADATLSDARGPDDAAPDAAAPDAAAEAGPVSLRIIAFNDFHGQLRPLDVGDGTELGGAARLATQVERLRIGAERSVLVSAGDLVGGSPLLSAAFHDEPTIAVMNALGLDLNAVGNHEFDEGVGELLRMHAGGCHPDDGCRGPAEYPGAAFPFLAANTLRLEDGETLFPPYAILEFEGVKVAFVGVTLEGTALTTTELEGVEFRDEAETVNALVPELRAAGAEAIVVLLHEGIRAGVTGCNGASGAALDIVAALDPAVDLVLSGHTHNLYLCDLDGVLLSSAGSRGQLLTAVDVVLDPDTGDVASWTAESHPVGANLPADPDIEALLASYEETILPIEGRVVGSITADLVRSQDSSGQSTLGSVLADAQLAATADEGSVVAFMNTGGVRADLRYGEDGEVTYGELFAVQPFNNVVVTLDLTGAQLHALLEQGVESGGHLLVSAGFEYTWSPDGVDPATILVGGDPLDLEATYR